MSKNPGIGDKADAVIIFLSIAVVLLAAAIIGVDVLMDILHSFFQ